MTAASITVDNGGLTDYDLATKTETWAAGTRSFPAGIIVDGADGSITRLAVIAEDAALSGGEGGLTMLGMRKDARVSTAGTDGDATLAVFSAQGAQFVEAAIKQVVVAANPAALTTVTTTYTAGDVLGGVFSAAGFARANGLSGRIVGVYMTDDSDVIGSVDLFVFDTTVSPGADNAAFAPSDADNKLGLGIIELSGAYDASSNRNAYWSGSLPFVCTASSTTIYFVAVTRSANAVFAGGATSLTFRFLIEQD